MKHNKTLLIFPYDFDPTLISYLNIIRKICEFSGDITPIISNNNDTSEEKESKEEIIRKENNNNNNNTKNTNILQPVFNNDNGISISNPQQPIVLDSGEPG